MLVGSVNFCMLDIDDLFGEDCCWGLCVGYCYGNNGYGNGCIFVGVWCYSEDGGDCQFGLLIVVSSSCSSEYVIVWGQKNIVDLGSQQFSSWLLKVCLQLSDQYWLDLSYMCYENDFYYNYLWQIFVCNQCVSYYYMFYLLWIDLCVIFVSNKIWLFYLFVEDFSYIGWCIYSSLSSWIFDNISCFDIGVLQVCWNIGIKYQLDIYVVDIFILCGVNLQGCSQLDSVFSMLELQYDVYVLIVGLCQDCYGIRGYVLVCLDVFGQCVEINGGGIDVCCIQYVFSFSLVVLWQVIDLL